MVYNNGFPMNYQYLQAQPQYGFQPAYVQQPYVQQPVQQPVQQQPPSSTANQSMTNITWVQGEAGARAFSVPNGETYALWDSDEQLIYLKSVDQSGKPTMITLEYVNKENIVDEKSQQSQYVTQEQFEQLNKQFEALQEKLNSLKPQQQNNNRNKGGRNNG